MSTIQRSRLGYRNASPNSTFEYRILFVFAMRLFLPPCPSGDFFVCTSFFHAECRNWNKVVASKIWRMSSCILCRSNAIQQHIISMWSPISDYQTMKQKQIKLSRHMKYNEKNIKIKIWDVQRHCLHPSPLVCQFSHTPRLAYCTYI